MPPQTRESVIAALREGAARTQAQYVTILRADLLLVLEPETEPVPADPVEQPPEEVSS